MPPTTIDELILHLHQIIGQERGAHSRAAYFPALALRLAAHLRGELAGGRFADRPFAARLIVAWLGRYLAAHAQARGGAMPPQAWLLAFEAAESSRPTIDQHLILGINASINLDLGVALADLDGAPDLAAHRRDFQALCDLLVEQLDAVMKTLHHISPLTRLLDDWAGGPKDHLIHAGVRAALARAWQLALRLRGLPEGAARQAAIVRADSLAALLGRPIWQPGPLVAPVAALVRLHERGTVQHAVDTLLASGGALRPSGCALPAPAPRPRERIAILGGGIAALAAAFELTDPCNPRRDQYEITVYELGWRLGGKGASGRNLDPERHLRSEEHGLHAWFGFYDNAFNLIQRCYAELGRPADAPLATWRDAFKPLNDGALITDVDRQPLPWPIRYPPNRAAPGTGNVLLPPRAYVAMALWMLYHSFRGSALVRQRGDAPALDELLEHLPPEARPLVAYALPRMGGDAADADVKLLFLAATLFSRVSKTPHEPIEWLSGDLEPDARGWLKVIDDGLHALSLAFYTTLDRSVLLLLGALVRVVWRRVRDQLADRQAAYRLWVALNFVYANFCGVIEERLLSRGFDVINGLDYRDWLARYAYDDGGLMLGSPIVAAIYDSAFAYLDGQPQFEAGTALLGLIRATLTYKEAFGWKMQAGTGEAIFVPLYQVLRRRGVKFCFLHRVTGLELGAGARPPVERITLERRQYLKDGAPAEVGDDVLVTVKGLPCWPAAPLHPLSEPAPLTLERGRDFDTLLLGIAVGGLAPICDQLADRSARWREMLGALKTVGTQSLQLWLKKTGDELGWAGPLRPIVSFVYARDRPLNPLNAWGNMSEIIDREDWPASLYPLSLAYFVSALPDAPDAGAARAPGDDPARQVLRAAEQLLEHIWMIWPRATQPGQRGHAFDWQNLVAGRKGGAGAERLKQQYWRANTDGWERYVLSVPGSSARRLPAHSDEFPNLYLAGDWTANGLNCGCMEAAVMSGMLASQAISGFPERHMIVGVDFGRAPQRGGAPAEAGQPGR